MITHDLEKTAAIAACREDYVMRQKPLPPWADCYADVLYVEAIERQGRRAVAEVRAEMAPRHQRLRSALDTLKGGAR